MIIESVYIGTSITIQTKLDKMCFRPELKTTKKMHLFSIPFDEHPEEKEIEEKEIVIPTDD